MVSIWAPDRDGRMTDVLLGFGNPADYIENEPFFGAVIGRVANRIAGGRFTLDGKEYELALNDSNGKIRCTAATAGGGGSGRPT